LAQFAASPKVAPQGSVEDVFIVTIYPLNLSSCRPALHLQYTIECMIQRMLNITKVSETVYVHANYLGVSFSQENNA
jgi:hypothetical protein